MKISVRKTKAMTISKEPICCKLEIDGGMVKQVMEFDYWGVKNKHQFRESGIIN